MILDDFLSGDAFTMVNKRLAKIIWLWQTVLLSEMIYQRKKAWEEIFEFSWKEMEDELWISPKTQQRYINELKELWFIYVEKWGLHNKNFFRIDDDKIISVFPNGESTLVKMTTVQKSKWPHSSYIYKKGYKKEDGENSTTSLDTALEEFKEMRKMIKKPLTSKALNRLVAKLDKLWKNDTEKSAILNQSVDHCWQDVYPLKEPITTEPQTNREWVEFFDKCWWNQTERKEILDKYWREKFEKVKKLWTNWCATKQIDENFIL